VEGCIAPKLSVANGLHRSASMTIRCLRAPLLLASLLSLFVLASIGVACSSAGDAGTSVASASGGGRAGAGALSSGGDAGARGGGATAADGGAAVVTCTGCPVLPLEVLGSAGTTVDLTVQVPDPAKAVTLWMQIHELDSEQKASVAINAGPYVAVTNQSATVLGQTALDLGGIGGGYHTLSLEMPVPAGALVAGANTVHFRFNGTDGVSIGYRVLAFNLLDASGQQLLPPASSFAAEDPDTWLPPLPGASDIAAGSAAWHTASLVDSPLNPTPILAHCADCHAQDGRDLKYFNYSNLSIAERAQFHGLSKTQGDQIASYIRSLTTPNPGRVWNPPYQPGPALKAADPASWSAGAGLAAVVEPESAVSSVLPGNGATDPAALFDGQQIEAFDTQDTPIPLQLLDWNRWLPNVAPIDSLQALGLSFTAQGDWTKYQAIRQRLSGQGQAVDGSGIQTKAQYLDTFFIPTGVPELELDLEDWANSMTYDLYPKLYPANYQSYSLTNCGSFWTPQSFNAVYSVGKWNAVKQWEIMQEFSLENLQTALFGANGRPRSWFAERHVFDVSPGLIARFSNCDQLDTSVMATQPADLHATNINGANEYLSNAWYQLQVILNPGTRNREVGGFNAVDWAYMDGHFFNFEQTAHEGEPMRVAEWLLASMREHDSSVGPDNPGYGWNLRDSAPSLIGIGGFPSHDFPALKSEPNALAMVDAIYQVWLEKTATFDQATWKVSQNLEQPGGDPGWPGDHTGAMSYGGGNVGTEQWVVGDLSQGGNSALGFSLADAFFAGLPELKAFGMAPAILDAWASFLKFMWPAPQNGWDAFRGPTAKETATTTVTAEADVESVNLAWTPVAGATSYNVKRSRAGDAAPLTAALLLDATSFTDRRRAVGQAYQYVVSANFPDGEGADSAPATATPVTGRVARWTFNEADGPALDSERLQNPAGVLIGGATRTSNGSGSALALDGTGYLSFPISLHRWLGSTATVSIWLRTTATGRGTSAWPPGPALMGSPFSELVNSSAYTTEYGVLDASGHIGAVFGEQSAVFSHAAVNDGQWHHLAFTRDASSGAVQIFVDGRLSGQGTSGSGVLGERVYSVGKLDNVSSTSQLAGALDDLQIYDFVLDAGAIAALYAAGPG
jgi:hypothetical protein